jgi:hypothetical protein
MTYKLKYNLLGMRLLMTQKQTVQKIKSVAPEEIKRLNELLSFLTNKENETKYSVETFGTQIALYARDNAIITSTAIDVIREAGYSIASVTNMYNNRLAVTLDKSD